MVSRITAGRALKAFHQSRLSVKQKSLLDNKVNETFLQKIGSGLHLTSKPIHNTNQMNKTETEFKEENSHGSNIDFNKSDKTITAMVDTSDSNKSNEKNITDEIDELISERKSIAEVIDELIPEEKFQVLDSLNDFTKLEASEEEKIVQFSDASKGDENEFLDVLMNSIEETLDPKHLEKLENDPEYEHLKEEFQKMYQSVKNATQNELAIIRNEIKSELALIRKNPPAELTLIREEPGAELKEVEGSSSSGFLTPLQKKIVLFLVLGTLAYTFDKILRMTIKEVSEKKMSIDDMQEFYQLLADSIKLPYEEGLKRGLDGINNIKLEANLQIEAIKQNTHLTEEEKSKLISKVNEFAFNAISNIDSINARIQENIDHLNSVPLPGHMLSSEQKKYYDEVNSLASSFATIAPPFKILMGVVKRRADRNLSESQALNKTRHFVEKLDLSRTNAEKTVDKLIETFELGTEVLDATVLETISVLGGKHIGTLMKPIVQKAISKEKVLELSRIDAFEKFTSIVISSSIKNMLATGVIEKISKISGKAMTLLFKTLTDDKVKLKNKEEIVVACVDVIEERKKTILQNCETMVSKNKQVEDTVIESLKILGSGIVVDTPKPLQLSEVINRASRLKRKTLKKLSSNEINNPTEKATLKKANDRNLEKNLRIPSPENVLKKHLSKNDNEINDPIEKASPNKADKAKTSKKSTNLRSSQFIPRPRHLDQADTQALLDKWNLSPLSDRMTSSNETIAQADGTVISPDGTITKPDGTVISPDGTITKPDGTIISPDGTIISPDGTIISPDGTITNPDSNTTNFDEVD